MVIYGLRWLMDKGRVTDSASSRRRSLRSIIFDVTIATGVAAICALAFAAAMFYSQGGRWFDVKTPSMGQWAPVGTLILVEPTPYEDITVGDVLSFKPPTPSGKTYTHRVADITERGIITRGDINNVDDPWVITQEHIIGKVEKRIWAGGWALRALPYFIIGLIVTFIVSHYFVKRKWLWQARMFGVTASFTIMAWIVRPFLNAQMIGYVGLRDGVNAKVVSTGILPIKATAVGGTSVDLIAGQVGYVFTNQTNEQGYFQVIPTSNLTFWWWVVAIAFCALPLLFVLIVGLPPLDPEIDDPEDPTHGVCGNDCSDDDHAPDFAAWIDNHSRGKPSTAPVAPHTVMFEAHPTSASDSAPQQPEPTRLSISFKESWRMPKLTGVRGVAAATALVLAVPTFAVAIAIQPTKGAIAASVENGANTAGMAALNCQDATTALPGALLVYSMNAATGMTDLTGNGYNGTLYNAAGTSGRHQCTRDPQITTQFDYRLNTWVGTPLQMTNPTTFSVEMRFRANDGWGVLTQFAQRSNRLNGRRYDRMLYLVDGQLRFGLGGSGSLGYVTSPDQYADGQWHHVVVTMGPAGVQLYVDDVLVASDASLTQGDNFTGFWRFGNGYQSGWPGARVWSAPEGFWGDAQFAAIYNRQLTAAEVSTLYNAAF